MAEDLAKAVRALDVEVSLLEKRTSRFAVLDDSAVKKVVAASQSLLQETELCAMKRRIRSKSRIGFRVRLYFFEQNKESRGVN